MPKPRVSQTLRDDEEGRHREGQISDASAEVSPSAGSGDDV